jgi:hypothetical protein
VFLTHLLPPSSDSSDVLVPLLCSPQKHPEKWVIHRPAAGSAASNEPLTIIVPSIEEMFPVDKALDAPGINHYENIIRAVYDYWRGKHQRAGRPLIQRLW